MSPSLSPLLRFTQCERVSAVHDAENVAVRIFEPGDLVIAGDVHVALALRLRQVVVLERDALRLERADDLLDVVDRPGQGSGFVSTSEGGPIHVDGGVATLEDDGLVVFGAGSTESQRFTVELGSRVEVPDRERCDRVGVS